MATTYSDPAQDTPYQPTAAQQARADALRRFNLWAIYVPLGLITAAILVLVVAMIVLAVIQPRWRPTTSAVADLLVILTILPTLLLCTLLPAGAGFVFIDSRRKGRAPLRSLRTLLWRLDTLVSRVQRIVSDGVDRFAPQTARIRTTFVRLETTARSLVRRKTDSRRKQNE